MRKYFYLIATDQKRGILIGAVKCVLWLLSLIFGLLVLLRKELYRMHIAPIFRLNKPVISIGNLTVGGTGKTPLVNYIASILINKAAKPVILTRGYMGSCHDKKMDESDEAAMLRNGLPDVPVLVGGNRVKNAKSYLKDHAVDVFLLDDGYQHRRLSRDIDIVTIDSSNPWGNGCLLPRGILREPKGALGRADIFVLTKTDQGKEHLPRIKNEVRKINPKAVIIETVHKPVCFLDVRSGTVYELFDIKKKRVCAVSSIAAPGAFIATLTGLGAEIGERFDFEDHHQYSREDFNRIVKCCQEEGITSIIMTQKDAVKIKPLLGEVPEDLRVLSLKIMIDITHGEGRLIERIYSVL